MYSKTLICVQRLRRMEIIPDYTGVGLGRFPLKATKCVDRDMVRRCVEHNMLATNFGIIYE